MSRTAPPAADPHVAALAARIRAAAEADDAMCEPVVRFLGEEAAAASAEAIKDRLIALIEAIDPAPSDAPAR